MRYDVYHHCCRPRSISGSTIYHLSVIVPANPLSQGHRLKNVGGTKTIQALANCKATRRVILSGTPVQNDLQELFAIASFVAPGLLGIKY